MSGPAGRACLKYKISLVANLLLVNSQAGAGTACVTCTKPNLNIRCEIRKSDAIVALPFGPELLNRACIQAIKSSYGAYGCHVLKETPCLNWPVKSFSLKEAKRAVLGETLVAATSESQNPPSQAPPPESSAQAPQNALTTVWQKFLALIAWH